jgi:hypothetical protein
VIAFVPTMTRWPAPSPEISVRPISTPAGAVTEGGVSLPSAPIVNVAGRRTLEAPAVLMWEVVVWGVVAVLDGA